MSLARKQDRLVPLNSSSPLKSSSLTPTLLNPSLLNPTPRTVATEAIAAAVQARKDEQAPTAPDTVSRKPAQPDVVEAKPAVAAAAQPSRFGVGRKAFAGVAAVLLLAAAGVYGHHWWTAGRFTVATDDAYVRADNTTMAAKISGYITTLRVADNSYVRAGDVIATIDDGDYKLALDAARGKVATQQGTVERIGQQIVAQQASVAQAKAQLLSAQAAAKRAASELDRQQALASKDYASKQTLETSIANRDQAEAGIQSAAAAITLAQANVEVTQAQQQEARHTLNELDTARAKAERDLSFAVIRAPVDGMIGNRAMQVGDFVQTGQRLASLVPLDSIYIDANFKETQLERLKAGLPVDISVDALPDRVIEGQVASVSPASGSVFSLLPPDNATGNFTKIVQRVAVRVRVPKDVADERLLRPGMSVVVSINTKSPPQADGAAPTAVSMATGRDTSSVQ